MSLIDQAPVLAIKNVTKTFGSFKALDAIDLSVNRGEIFGFLGPNGAGKSTTIRLILDILRPDAGSGGITILGKDNRLAASTHQNVGYLSGDMVLDGDLTGRQYLQFINNLHGGNHTATISRLVDILEADINVKIGNYSRGNRQKICLIAAMLHNPKLLILDEPTSGFDPLVQEKFAELLREYVVEGGTVLMSSHVLAEVQNLCDRLSFIKNGKIIATKTVHELIDTKAKRITIQASPADIKALLKDYGKQVGLQLVASQDTTITFSFAGDVRPLLRYFATKPIIDITIREPELEEIFGQYYQSAGETKE